MQRILLASTLLALLSLPASADWSDRFGPPALVTLSEIRETPQAYLEKVVRIRARFDSLGETYNAVYTRFVPEAYTNFRAWGEEQELWKQKEFTNSFPFFFFNKTHPESKTLYEIERYAPLEMVLYIHDSYDGMVWIDVVGIHVIDGGLLNDRILRHITRGNEFFVGREWDACLREFKDALQYPLPRAYAASIQRDVALIYYYKKGPEFRQAAQLELEKAVQLDPDHLYLRRLYRRVREQNRLAEQEGRRRKTRHGAGDG